MLVLARPKEGRGGTADGDKGGGSDKGNSVGVTMVPLLLRVVAGITRAIMKVAYTYGNTVILCPIPSNALTHNSQ